MRYSVVLLATCLCFVIAKTGFAQSEPLNIQLPELQLRAFSTSRFPLMNLTFDLRDNNGETIPNLTSSQIDLQEDGQSRQLTALFHEINNDLVISLALVIDVSGSSQGQPLQNAIEATTNLLDNLNGKDEVAFIPVRTDVSVDIRQLDSQNEMGFTKNYNQIRQVVNRLEIQGDQTALYNAMFKAIKLTSAQDTKRRAIIVMTDGRDFTNSVITEDDPIDEANRNNIPIFTIGLGQPRNELYLERVAARTGGTFQSTNNPEELAVLFNEVLNSLKQEYRLTYNSGLLAKDQAEHQLTLSVNTRGTSVSNTLYFDLLSDGFRTTASPPTPTLIPTVVDTPLPTPTTVFVPLTTPTSQVSEQAIVNIATEIPLPTEAATPTPTLIPTRIAINLSLDLENKTWFARIQDNPSPIIIVALILLFLIILFALIRRLYKRIKNVQTQQASQLDENLDSQTPVTKYNLPVAEKKNQSSATTESKEHIDKEEVVHPTIKDSSINLTDQELGNITPVAKSDRIEHNNTLEKKKVYSEFEYPVEKPQLIRITDKQDFEIINEHVFVGRHPKSDILLKDETVSARHAVLILHEEKILIQDIGSTNGTFVNGEQIERRKALKDGDHLHFGKVKMLYRAPKEEDIA